MASQKMMNIRSRPFLQLIPLNREMFSPGRTFLLTSVKHIPPCLQRIKNWYKDISQHQKKSVGPPRKGRKSVGGDDDGDDDDEDWTGGARRLSNSGRRGNYSRSRQRL
ncbi:hypothetical protein GBA52_028602 [Prunus armeniaca]|nr:hypothetical protein GBA52_028602 [Prunus armeniaca]